MGNYIHIGDHIGTVSSRRASTSSDAHSNPKNSSDSQEESRLVQRPRDPSPPSCESINRIRAAAPTCRGKIRTPNTQLYFIVDKLALMSSIGRIRWRRNIQPKFESILYCAHGSPHMSSRRMPYRRLCEYSEHDRQMRFPNPSLGHHQRI